MTDAEIEMELASLRSRLAQLEQAQESRTAQWRNLAIEYRLYGLAFCLFGVALGLLYFWIPKAVPMPMGLAFAMIGGVLVMMVRALQVAPACPR
jgi:NADH:ubiquinone oxidoreductase subunit 3 (subunit A)